MALGQMHMHVQVHVYMRMHVHLYIMCVCACQLTVDFLRAIAGLRMLRICRLSC